jgi:hypothetical protein
MLNNDLNLLHNVVDKILVSEFQINTYRIITQHYTISKSK